ncbi:MAG: YARHG domain-containing protein [Clostridia bacterium]|nr:YARHG domain-containing protein [Clostridia bacterium]
MSEIEQRRSEQRQRQRRQKIAIIALICLLAAGAAGAGAYYIMNGINAPKTEQTLPAASPSASPMASPTVDPSASPLASPLASPAAAASPAPGTSAAPQASSKLGGTTQANAGQSWSATGAATAKSGNGTASGSSSGNSTSGNGSSTSKSASGGSSSSASGSSQASRSSSGGSGSSQGAASNSGIVSNKISAKLITGGEVLKNNATGKYLMTFTMGNTKYYANVSEGSTTDMIKNKPFTIDADATSETYEGNTIYEISSMTNYSGDYILANSGTKLLTESDIRGLSKYDLALARNEIYARHGRKFQTPEYSSYFAGKSWYKINPNYNYSDDNSNLNEIELANINLILKAENS